jgi:hypothetical protein
MLYPLAMEKGVCAHYDTACWPSEANSTDQNRWTECLERFREYRNICDKFTDQTDELVHVMSALTPEAPSCMPAAVR